MPLFNFLGSHAKLQKVWRWWHKRQSNQLSLEAEIIRDGMLQESFAMRRSLELLFVLETETLADRHQDLLLKIESFHQSLEQLSNRLKPPYLEDSLPLAIQQFLESWQRRVSNLNFHLELPTYWSREPPDLIRVILSSIDELLKITLATIESEISIHIKLEQKEQKGELMVKIAYPDVSTFNSTINLGEWEYLQQSFQILTSGECFWFNQELTQTWYFRWRLQQTPVVNGEGTT